MPKVGSGLLRGRFRDSIGGPHKDFPMGPCCGPLLYAFVGASDWDA